MVAAAKWHRKLVADFQSNGSGLGKAQVMRIRGLSAADQARLRCDKLEMRLVASPLGFANSELAFVDFGRFHIEDCGHQGRGL